MNILIIIFCFQIQAELIGQAMNPCHYRKLNESKFLLLASYFRATSVASERVFCMDSLVITDNRQSMIPDRSSNIMFLQDYLRRRVNKKDFKL